MRSLVSDFKESTASVELFKRRGSFTDGAWAGAV